MKYKDYSTDLLTKAVLKAVLHVSEHLLHQKAVLLPDVCHDFLEAFGITHYGGIASVDLRLEMGDSTVQFSSRWLLHQLIIYLHPYLQYKCIHMKFGTVLFRKGGDLLVSLSWALGVSSASHKAQMETLDYTSFTSKTTGQQHQQSILLQAGNVVNDLLHDEIRRQATTTPQTRHDPLNLNIDEYLKEVNPLLVNFLTSATRTITERRHSYSHKQLVILRRYVSSLSCASYFTVRIPQPPPTHNLLADVVEVCGSSRQLLKMLNRIGCVSSPDTHDRFVTHHAELQRHTNVWNEIPEHTFTIASTDNIDKLHSYSAVYCGDQQ